MTSSLCFIQNSLLNKFSYKEFIKCCWTHKVYVSNLHQNANYVSVLRLRFWFWAVILFELPVMMIHTGIRDQLFPHKFLIITCLLLGNFIYGWLLTQEVQHDTETIMHASYFLRDASLMFNKQEQQVISPSSSYTLFV